METEHRVGDVAAVSALYTQLVTYLADLGTKPSDATTELHGRLARFNPASTIQLEHRPRPSA
jgi:hypothetical protein